MSNSNTHLSVKDIHSIYSLDSPAAAKAKLTGKPTARVAKTDKQEHSLSTTTPRKPTK